MARAIKYLKDHLLALVFFLLMSLGGITLFLQRRDHEREKAQIRATLESQRLRAKAGGLEAQRRILAREAAQIGEDADALHQIGFDAEMDIEAQYQEIRKMRSEDVASQFTALAKQKGWL
jgi:hypothetical protein